MSILKQLFGPSKEEVWSELARQIGAQFNDGGMWGGTFVQAQVRDWTVTLDTYTVSTGKSSVTYTRIRAPFINRDGFHLQVARAGLFTELGKWLGMQDIEVGDAAFDPAFVVQGNNEERVRALLSNPEVRSRIAAQPAFHLNIRDDEGFFSARYPQGVDVLYFHVVGVIRDVTLLRGLFELFAEVLNGICHLDSGYEDDPAEHLRALAGPGGMVQSSSGFSSNIVLWDGNPARHRAAEALGRLRHAEAVFPLVGVLKEDDAILRVKAIHALGEIGDPRVVATLIPYLGDAPDAAAVTAESLRKLGEGRLVDAFHAALEGVPDARAELAADGRAEIVPALMATIQRGRPTTAGNAALAAAELSGLAALPVVRKRLRELDRDDPARGLFEQAIAELEKRSRLPRAAGTPTHHAEALPRTGSGPGSADG